MSINSRHVSNNEFVVQVWLACTARTWGALAELLKLSAVVKLRLYKCYVLYFILFCSVDQADVGGQPIACV